MEKPGIYKVVSKKDPKKSFIFLAVNALSKWESELTKLKAGIHENKKLQVHFDEFGAGDLKFSLIEACSKFIWNERLEFWIKSLNPYFNSQDSKSNTKLKPEGKKRKNKQ
jgi:hypothetical protein